MLNKFKIILLLIISTTLLFGCQKEEKIEETLEYKTMTQITKNIINIKSSNLSFDEIQENLSQYESLIAQDIWDSWFNLEEEYVKQTFYIAEKYNSYPISYNINSITYGNPVIKEHIGSDGLVYMANVTMRTKVNSVNNPKVGEIELHFLFEYDKEGILQNFVQWERKVK